MTAIAFKDFYFCIISFCFSYASLQALASWSAQEVALCPQITPESFFSISSTVQPSTRRGIAFKFPLHPPLKEIFVTIFPSIFNFISVEHVFLVLYVYSIISSNSIAILRFKLYTTFLLFSRKQRYFVIKNSQAVVGKCGM